MDLAGFLPLPALYKTRYLHSWKIARKQLAIKHEQDEASKLSPTSCFGNNYNCCRLSLCSSSLCEDACLQQNVVKQMLQNSNGYLGHVMEIEVIFFHFSPKRGSIDMKGIGSFLHVPSMIFKHL